MSKRGWDKEIGESHSDVPPDSDTGPKAGTKWHRLNSRGYGFVISHPAETRHVIDRTLGGNVVYISGRKTRFSVKVQCTLAEWQSWVHDAHEVMS